MRKLRETMAIFRGRTMGVAVREPETTHLSEEQAAAKLILVLEKAADLIAARMTPEQETALGLNLSADKGGDNMNDDYKAAERKLASNRHFQAVEAELASIGRDLAAGRVPKIEQDGALRTVTPEHFETLKAHHAKYRSRLIEDGVRQIKSDRQRAEQQAAKAALRSKAEAEIAKREEQAALDREIRAVERERMTTFTGPGAAAA
jgi:hypothetical protein